MPQIEWTIRSTKSLLPGLSLSQNSRLSAFESAAQGHRSLLDVLDGRETIAQFDGAIYCPNVADETDLRIVDGRDNRTRHVADLDSALHIESSLQFASQAVWAESGRPVFGESQGKDRERMTMLCWSRIADLKAPVPIGDQRLDLFLESDAFASFQVASPREPLLPYAAAWSALMLGLAFASYNYRKRRQKRSHAQFRDELLAPIIHMNNSKDSWLPDIELSLS
ncbi:MAG: hypothetical protein KDA42_02255 [Planctomycetales bacterium]|nr:hypothetical protein [Planctomycetales bacterium]